MAARWAVKTTGEEWLIDVQDGRVTLMQCRGPFGLPVATVTIPCDVAGSVAKLIVQARNSTKRKRSAQTVSTEHST
jgi:hypothetical protein